MIPKPQTPKLLKEPLKRSPKPPKQESSLGFGDLGGWESTARFFKSGRMLPRLFKRFRVLGLGLGFGV